MVYPPRTEVRKKSGLKWIDEMSSRQADERKVIPENMHTALTEESCHGKIGAGLTALNYTAT